MTASEHLVVIDAVPPPKTSASLFSSVNDCGNRPRTFADIRSGGPSVAVTEQISGIYSGIDAVPRRAASLAASIKSLARFFVTWFDSCAEHYAAAAIYQQLSRLSDAELRKRGLSRDTLLRDVFLHLIPE